MFIFILLFISAATAAIILKININHINILRSSWMYDTETNTHITYILDGYTKDRDVGPGDYIAAGEKSVKIDLYRIFIIVVDILNGPDIIILVDTAYYSIFLANIISIKCF